MGFDPPHSLRVRTVGVLFYNLQRGRVTHQPGIKKAYLQELASRLVIFSARVGDESTQEVDIMGLVSNGFKQRLDHDDGEQR